MNLSLRQLRYFARIADLGNMTRAAETLNVAQTALGLQIRNLEAELGVQLIERHSRGIRLTEAGALFHGRLRDVFAALDDAIADVRAAGTADHTPVYIGLTPSILSMLGPGLFELAGEMSADHPVKFVEALSFNLVAAMRREELDFALAFNVGASPGIVRTALLEEKLFLITAGGDAQAGVPVSFQNVIRSDLALPGRQDIIWTIVHETAAYLSLPVNVAFEVQSTSAIKRLIERGVATSVMPYGIVASEVRDGVLSARPIDNSRVVRTLFLIQPPSSPRVSRASGARTVIREIARRYASALGPYHKMLVPELMPGPEEAGAGPR